jgi:hypothetical protein
MCTHGQTHVPFCIRFEIFMAVTMKNAAFWNVMPWCSCNNQRFGGMYLLHHLGVKNQELLVAFYIIPSALIPSTSMMEAVHSSEMSVLTRTTLCRIQEDGILHSVCLIYFLSSQKCKDISIIFQQHNPQTIEYSYIFCHVYTYQMLLFCFLPRT